MNRLELAAYSYWQHSRRARRAIAGQDREALGDALWMIAQIEEYATRDSLKRCCAATARHLRRHARRRFGRSWLHLALRAASGGWCWPDPKAPRGTYPRMGPDNNKRPTGQARGQAPGPNNTGAA
jgi:hypothetical protein